MAGGIRMKEVFNAMGISRDRTGRKTADGVAGCSGIKVPLSDKIIIKLSFSGNSNQA
jgi:hypothetical protein